MKIEKITVAVPETPRESHILKDVCGFWYPRRLPIYVEEGQWRSDYEFYVSDDLLAKVEVELAKTDEQRTAEFRNMMAQRGNRV